MKLYELFMQIKSLIEIGHENDVVLITLSQASCGARASVGIQDICVGFDWEHDQIRIITDEPIIKKYNDRDVGKLAICIECDYGTNKRRVRKCPICENHLSKKDRYCGNCGQAIVGGV